MYLTGFASKLWRPLVLEFYSPEPDLWSCDMQIDIYLQREMIYKMSSSSIHFSGCSQINCLLISVAICVLKQGILSASKANKHIYGRIICHLSIHCNGVNGKQTNLYNSRTHGLRTFLSNLFKIHKSYIIIIDRYILFCLSNKLA